MANKLFIGGQITQEQAEKIVDIIAHGELCCSYIDGQNNNIMNIEEFMETNETLSYIPFILQGLDSVGLFKLNDDNDSDWSELKDYLTENNIQYSHRRIKKLVPLKIIP